MQKNISVILTVFNSSKYLFRCLDSIVCQLNDQIELVIVDDCSTDDSIDILKNYAARWPQIVLIENSKNFGPGKSRNIALTYCSGRYVAIIDSDDYINDVYFQELLDVAENTDSDIVFGKIIFTNGSSEYEKFHNDYSLGNKGVDSLAVDCKITAPWGKLYNKEFLDKFDLTFNEQSLIGEDIPFTWMSYCFATNISFTDKAVYTYQVNNVGCGSIDDGRILGIFAALEQVKSKFYLLGESSAKKHSLVYLFLTHAQCNYARLLSLKNAENLQEDYLTKCRNFLDFDPDEVRINPYLNEKLKIFFFHEVHGVSRLPTAEAAFEWPLQSMQEKRWKEACKRWAFVRAVYPDRAEPWIQGAVAHIEADELTGAERLLSHARDCFPGNPNALIQSAELAIRRREFEEASTLLERLRAQFPQHVQSWLRSARLAELQGDSAGALAFNKKARQSWPDLTAPFVQYAELAMRAESWRDAAERWDEVRKRFPDLPSSYIRGAEAQRRMNRMQEARKLELALRYGVDILQTEEEASNHTPRSDKFTKIIRPLELVWTKAIFNLRSEVHRNYLSYGWWVLEPLLHMVVYYLVFGVLLERGGENFPVFLLTGLIPWMWFSKAVSISSGSILAGQQLMLKVGLPATVFPLVSLLQTTLKQLPVFALLVGFLMLQGIDIGAQWWALLPVILVQILLMTAFAGAVAAVIPFVRDLSYLVPTGLTFLMFLSGIFYDYRTIAEEWQGFFLLNPMAFLLKCYREIFVQGTMPDMTTLYWWGLWGALSCALLLMAFKRLRYVYPRIVME